MGQAIDRPEFIPLSPKMTDLTGRKFGRLTVLGLIEKLSYDNKWLCLCECGNKTSVASRKLKSEHTRSCGCLSRETASKNNRIHGMNDTRIHSIWSGIKSRCNDKSNENYGGRGISYDPRWETFEGFYEDMKEGYSEVKSIDRIDVNGDYCKDNCRWATKIQQARNTRDNLIVSYNGKDVRLVDLYEELGCDIVYSTVYNRIRKGWDVGLALTAPPHKGGLL